MIFREKAFWRCLFFVQRTAGELKDPVAYTAMEVMMVSFPRPFIKSSTDWMVESQEPAFFQEELYVSIDGGLVQGRDSFTPCPEDLLDSQRPVQLPEYLLNCLFLGCLAFHD
ncbi:MAG: hypothetical protein A4E57_00852 [Syntrophorhabdaceae bacterium PtaU1.Bin034]|nr:MAG: hypothetical protein A4E57_00852 [Syntrophorhabdaceae bacterium PtaU1.Bin034]